MKDKTLLVLCDCQSAEHQLILRKFEGDEIDGVSYYIEVHLTKFPILERIVYAVKYIFGHQSRYGAFNEIILNDDTRKDIVNFLK